MKMGDAKYRKTMIRFEEEDDVSLIPGLPDDLAMECMVRVPYQFHSTMRSVCVNWRRLLSGSLFYRHRRRSRTAENLLFLVQPLKQTSPVVTGECDLELSTDGDSSVKEQEGNGRLIQHVHSTPRYGVCAYNVSFGTWHRIELGRDSVSIPLFCECVAVSGKIVLIGGWDPATLQPVPDVYILDLVGDGSGRSWRRGASMSTARSFFACAAVGPSKVYVAGGHDEQKNALNTAEVYDVETDEWKPLPPMEEARDEAVAMAADEDLGLCVLSGYGTDAQGRFRSDAEIYNPATRSWSKIENVWPFADLSPRGRTAAISAGGREYRLCYFAGGDRQIQNRREIHVEDRNLKLVMDTIQTPKSTAALFAAIGRDSCVVIGGGDCDGEGGLIMETDHGVESGKWRNFPTPKCFSGVPFSAASISM